MNFPVVSVILPVYNRELYIQDSITSILNQTYANFELIIVDDASTDGTSSKIEEIQDYRIRSVRNNKNLGVSTSRNIGLKLAKGEYIAFMDSDDISLPDRLEKQIKCFKNKPEVVICGTWIKFLNSNRIIKYKEYHEEIITSLLLSCSLVLGSSMYKRKPLLDFFFKDSLRFGEDYEFWCRTVWVGKVYNIQEPLLLYRLHDNQLSTMNKKDQIELDAELRLGLFKRLNYSSSRFPDHLLKKIFLFESYISVKEFSLFLEWLSVIKNKNKMRKIFPEKEFLAVLDRMNKEILFFCFFKTSGNGINKNWRLKVLGLLPFRFQLFIIQGKISEYKKLLLH